MQVVEGHLHSAVHFLEIDTEVTVPEVVMAVKEAVEGDAKVTVDAVARMETGNNATTVARLDT